MKGILLSTLIQCAGMTPHQYEKVRNEELKQLEKRGYVVLADGSKGKKEYVFVAEEDVDRWLYLTGSQLSEVYMPLYRHSVRNFKI
ncbi:MAG: hypothetical protein ACP5G8_09065 [Athalassotoga sp.]